MKQARFLLTLGVASSVDRDHERERLNEVRQAVSEAVEDACIPHVLGMVEVEHLSDAVGAGFMRLR